MKYFKQETNYTCALACVRMVISKYGLDISEQELVKELKPSPKYGTNKDDLIEFIKHKGFEAESVENSSIDAVRKAKLEGYEIILLVSVDVPHCIVYLEDNGNHLKYHDPYFGDNKSVLVKKFVSKNTDYPSIRWRTDIDTLVKYYFENELNLKELRKQEGVCQFIKIKYVK